jgi:hypothetical protein
MPGLALRGATHLMQRLASPSCSVALGTVVVWNREDRFAYRLQAYTLQHWVRGSRAAQHWFSEPKFTYTIQLATGGRHRCGLPAGGHAGMRPARSTISEQFRTGHAAQRGGLLISRGACSKMQMQRQLNWDPAQLLAAAAPPAAALAAPLDPDPPPPAPTPAQTARPVLQHPAPRGSTRRPSPLLLELQGVPPCCCCWLRHCCWSAAEPKAGTRDQMMSDQR